jgi:hypothetical protein
MARPLGENVAAAIGRPATVELVVEVKGVPMSDEEARERARESAEEAGRMAQERARMDAERIVAGVSTPPVKQEMLRQQGLIYGALIVVGVYMVQPFLTAPSLDTSATISIVAFSVAIPLLAALVMVNWQELFRGRRTPSVMVTIAQSVAQGTALVGLVAGFWHITWIAGVTFLAVAFVAIGIHSAGWYRLERTDEPTS